MDGINSQEPAPGATPNSTLILKAIALVVGGTFFGIVGLETGKYLFNNILGTFVTGVASLVTFYGVGGWYYLNSQSTNH